MPTKPATALVTLIVAIMSVVGALVTAPAATAAPQTRTWSALLADQLPASTDYPDARFAPDAHAGDFAAALSEQLASAPEVTPSADPDFAYLSDLKSVGIPTEDPADARAAIQLGHGIVDDLHANPNCGEVASIGMSGLKAGFTSYQAAVVVVSAAKWYGPDLLPMLRSCGVAPTAT